jgi:hypothetical protein
LCENYKHNEIHPQIEEAARVEKKVQPKIQLLITIKPRGTSFLKAGQLSEVNLHPDLLADMVPNGEQVRHKFGSG